MSIKDGNMKMYRHGGLRGKPGYRKTTTPLGKKNKQKREERRLKDKISK